MESPNKSFFDAFPPQTAFTLGFVTAVLSIGTLGFVLLGSCVLKGGCQGVLAAAEAEPSAVAVKNSAAGTGAAAAIPAGKVPAVTDKDHIRGDVNAELTIIEYSDFECPFCSRFHPTMQQVMEDYDGKVRWVLRHFPLSFHANAEPAAEAAECAAEQGKYWEFADGLFENQTALGDDLYQQLAKENGLNLSKFNDCLSSDRTLSIIDADAQGGAGAGVSGTPGSFLIDKSGNAQAIKGALPYASVKAMIDAALKS